MMTPFTARDGENLALYEWPLDDASTLSATRHGGDRDSASGSPDRVRGMVLIVHGLGEHALRYEHVAAALMRWGFVVRAFDLRGHGRSGGERGQVPTESALLDDLAEIVEDAVLRCQRLGAAQARSAGADQAEEPGHAAAAPRFKVPLILLGHSLGGLLASRIVSMNLFPVDGLVLSSPALDAGFSRWQKLLLAVLPKLLPDLVINNGLDARYLSRDPAVVARYRADDLVHTRISLRLGQFIVNASQATMAAAAHWHTPTLLMYAGADRLVSPAGSATFANRAATSPHVKPGTVTVRCFGEHYHELFNELESAAVFSELGSWLDVKFKANQSSAQQVRAQADPEFIASLAWLPTLP